MQKTPEQQRLSDIRYELKLEDMSDIQLFNHIFEKGAHYARTGKAIEVRASAAKLGRNEWILKVLMEDAKIIPIISSQDRHERNQAGPVQKPFYKP
jgi:hypothetical protein